MCTEEIPRIFAPGTLLRQSHREGDGQIRLILIRLWCSRVQAPHQLNVDLPPAGRIQQLLVSFPSRCFRRCWGAKILGILVAHRPGQRGWDSNCGVENLQRKVNSNSLEWGQEFSEFPPETSEQVVLPNGVNPSGLALNGSGFVEFRIRLQSIQ